MTPEQKVSLVGAVKDEYGLNCALAAVELPKSTWYYHQQCKVPYEERYADLRQILEEIARQFPEYGLPRIMVELRKTYRCNVNHKVVERLLRAWDLRIVHNTRQPRPSGIQQALTEAGQHANLVAQMAEIRLFEVLYTDFTELLFANGDRKAVLMPIVDHRSKMAAACAMCGCREMTRAALRQQKQASPTGGFANQNRTNT